MNRFTKARLEGYKNGFESIVASIEEKLSLPYPVADTSAPRFYTLRIPCSSQDDAEMCIGFFKDWAECESVELVGSVSSVPTVNARVIAADEYQYYAELSFFF